MSYFSYFPLTSYLLDKDTVDIRQARNILVRAKFSQYLKTREGLYESYQIKDGERPDTLAHKFYGRSELHWVILLFNEIIDPYYEWPLSQSELESYILYKYPGKAVYVDDTFFYADGINRNQKISSTEPTINGETKVEISQYQDGGVITKTLTAISYDPLMMKIVVRDDGWLENGVPEIRNITVINSNGNRIKTNIRYIEPNNTSIHNFVDVDNEVLDPRGSIDPKIIDTYGVTVRILLYTNPNDTIRIPSMRLTRYKNNSEYEYDRNEEKRTINILKPYFLQETLKQFSSLFSKNKINGI